MQVHGPGLTPGASGAGRGVEHRQAAQATETGERAEAAASGPDKLRPAHGVLRLLQEGHFQGVADARLRINFADEIAALQATSTARGAEGGAALVLEPVDTILEEFLGQESLDAELQGQIEEAAAAFREVVNGLFSAFDASTDPKGEALAVAIEGAFQAFLEALQALDPLNETAPADEVVPVEEEEVVPVEGEAPTPDEIGFGEFIDQLGAAFEEAIAALRESFLSAQVLPELSGPQGNSGAYAKFLEILNGLTGGGGDAESSGVDTAA